MHALVIVLIVLLSLVALALIVIAGIVLSIYWTLQPILGVLGKVSMGIEIVKFLSKRIRRLRRRSKDE